MKKNIVVEKIVSRRFTRIASLMLAAAVGLWSFTPLKAKADTVPDFSKVGSFSLDTTNANTVKNVFTNRDSFYALEGASNGTYKLRQYNNTPDASGNYTDKGQYSLKEKDSATTFTFDDVHYASAGITKCDISETSASPLIYVKTSGTGSIGSASYIYSFDLKGKEINGWNVSNLTGLTGYDVADLKATPDGGFALLMKSNQVQSSDSHYDYYLYKFDSSGNKTSSANVKSDVLSIPVYLNYESSVTMLISIFSDGRIALFPSTPRPYSTSSRRLGKVLIYGINLTFNPNETANFNGITTSVGQGVTNVYPTDDGVAIFEDPTLLGSGVTAFYIEKFSDSTDGTVTKTNSKAYYDNSSGDGSYPVVMNGTADVPRIFAFRQNGSNYTGKVDVYTYTSLISGSGTNETPLPTNTTPTNSVTTWQSAGQFKNANFAINNVAHAGGRYYVLQKDGDHVKMARYLEKVGTVGSYPVDSAFKTFDLKDNNGNVLDFNGSHSSYVKLISFDVASDGTMYVCVEDGNLKSDNTKDDYIYIYSSDGNCKNVISHEAMASNVNAGTSSAQSLKVLSNGNVAAFYCDSISLVDVYNANGTLLNEIGSGILTSANPQFSKLAPLHNGFDSGNYGNKFFLYLGVNSSATMGLLKWHYTHDGDVSYANYLSAETFDSDLTKVTSDTDIKETNFPLPANSIPNVLPSSIAGIMPTSIGAIIAQQGTDGTVKVDEYNNYDGTQGDKNPSIWQTSFKPAGAVSSSTLSGTETDPVVYSYGSDGQTIYVEGLQGSQTVKNATYVAPTITIGDYDGTTPTNKDITVTAAVENGTFDGTNKTASYTFTENGSHTFTASDGLGGSVSKTVTINNIDKTPPVITIGNYDGTTPTNKDITVTAATNEGTLNAASHTFTENGSFDFIATDAAGNKTTKTVTISNIEKSGPVITIAPYTTTPTNKDITVTAATNEGTFDGTNKTISHTFTENGSFDFTATDAAGNKTTKTVTINNIDKTPPVISIDPYETGKTDQPITVTAATNEGTFDGTNNTISHTFTSNGKFDFTATDAAGNTTTKTVTINSINKVGVSYETHVQNIGWQGAVSDGAESGTDGQGLRLEGIKVNLVNAPSGAAIKYQTQVQNIGWQNEVSNGALAGTEGQGLRLEGIKISLDNMPDYSIQYRVHVQNIGWQDWVSDGQLAGTVGQGLRLEAIEVKIVKKSDLPAGVSYQSQVQNIGWQGAVSDGALTGTEGQGLRMEGVKINLVNAPKGASIKYQTQVQNIGWQSEVSDGALAGTVGQSLRLEGIKIHLENMPGYSVQYRAHVQNIGWQDWVSDGQLAGTEGKGFRMEALEIRIVKN